MCAGKGFTLEEMEYPYHWHSPYFFAVAADGGATQDCRLTVRQGHLAANCYSACRSPSGRPGRDGAAVLAACQQRPYLSSRDREGAPILYLE